MCWHVELRSLYSFPTRRSSDLSEDTHLATWYWMRAYYFEKCKDDLILDAVWPAIESCRTHEKAQGRTLLQATPRPRLEDRKSTRLNSSHGYISYAVFCLKKKNT